MKGLGFMLYLLASPVMAYWLTGQVDVGYGVMILNFIVLFIGARSIRKKPPVDDRLTLPKICTVCWTKYPEEATLCQKDFANLTYRKSLGDNV
jgi:ribosomal protein L40E